MAIPQGHRSGLSLPSEGLPVWSDERGWRGWRGWMLGFFMAGIWLVFLSDAFRQAWHLHRTLGRLGGLAVLGLFVVLYLGHFAVMRATVWGSRSSTGPGWLLSRLGLVSWAGLVVLAGLAVLTIGQEGASTWVFLAVAGLWTFRLRIGLAVGVLLVVLYELLTLHVAGWQPNGSVSTSILLAMAAVTGGMLASQRQRALGEAREENARLAIQEERHRMARDVHDILGHSLTVITVKAELASRLMDVSPERARAEVADVERLARDALADVRQAVAGFREISLPAELARARATLAAAGVEADLPTATDAVGSPLREVCAWTLREGVTNVVRHSGASTCRVVLRTDGITITDNGSGQRPGSPGSGLVGLRERATAVGARLETRAVDPHGFELSLTALGAPLGTDDSVDVRAQA
jgi:two-component system sensor histidine kinase DesK